jgi:hypothetical protein
VLDDRRCQEDCRSALALGSQLSPGVSLVSPIVDCEQSIDDDEIRLRCKSFRGLSPGGRYDDFGSAFEMDRTPMRGMWAGKHA